MMDFLKALQIRINETKTTTTDDRYIFSNIGDETADVMCEILAFEADRRYVYCLISTNLVCIQP